MMFKYASKMGTYIDISEILYHNMENYIVIIDVSIILHITTAHLVISQNHIVSTGPVKVKCELDKTKKGMGIKSTEL